MATLTGIREDSNNYPEGVKIGEAIQIAFFEKSWLVPNVTYTPLDFGENGTLIIPMVDKNTNGGATDLCAEANVGSGAVSQWQVSITKKVSGIFDGCFTVAGIADKTTQKLLNDVKLEIMVEDYRQYVKSQMDLTNTPSTVAMGTGANAYITYFNARVLEFKKATKRMPTIAKVSSDFLAGLENDMLLRETNNGDFVLVNGFTGRIKETNIIEDLEQTEDMILMTSDAIGIGEPSSPKQIPNANVLGAFDYAKANGDQAGFSNGIISLPHIEASKASVSTYLHKFFGMGIKDANLIQYPKAVAAKSGN